MTIFNHDIYENIRTRAIVLHEDRLLMIPPRRDAGDGAWTLPGGGLCPHESLAECVRRETLEETGIHVRAGRVAFLREWIVPRHAHSTAPDPDGHGYGYGLEVFFYATPEEPLLGTRSEQTGESAPQWVLLSELPGLPLWPKELRLLGRRLLQGAPLEGAVSIVARLESPRAAPDHDPFA